MAERLEAHFENRIYYFYVVEKKPEELSITMYSTPFTFVKKEKGWENVMANRQQMTLPLIQQVVAAAGLN